MAEPTGSIIRMPKVINSMGMSTIAAPSQQAVTTAINGVFVELNSKLDESAVVQSAGSSTTNVMSQKAVTELATASVPIGIVQAYIGETAPNDKWLLCRGQAFSAESYPDLAELLPDLKIPDLRGVALRGLDANRGLDPNRELLSYQEDAMQKIEGAIANNYTTMAIYSSGAFILSEKATEKLTTYAGNAGYRRAGFDSSRVTRTNSQNETVMKNVAVNFIIKAR